MEAKFYFTILLAITLTGFPLKAQNSDYNDFEGTNSGVAMTSYYDDYDYYYTSRINRFHRSYLDFDFYSPLFTDIYWYSYKPLTWGMSIYGRTGSGFGFSFNYPVYYYGWGYGNWYDYDYGWHDPFYGNTWFYGYSPYYYGNHSPEVYNINIGRGWRESSRNNHLYENNRPVFNSFNNNSFYNRSSDYSVRNVPEMTRQPDYNDINHGTVSNPGNIRSVADGRRIESGNSINRNQTTITDNSRRHQESGQINGSSTVNQPNRNSSGSTISQPNGNNGNNTGSRLNGNNGNFGQNSSNNGNNGNNNDSSIDRNVSNSVQNNTGNRGSSDMNQPASVKRNENNNAQSIDRNIKAPESARQPATRVPTYNGIGAVRSYMAPSGSSSMQRQEKPSGTSINKRPTPVPSKRTSAPSPKSESSNSDNSKRTE